MKLPWRSRAEPTPIEEVPIEPPGPKIEIYSSPGLDGAVSAVPDDGNCKVLDLGPSVAANLEFLASFASYLQIVDAVDRGPAAANLGGPESVRLSTLNTLLDQHRRSFNLVLAWDVFNYLSPEQAERLNQSVAELCLPSARLHAIFFATDTMPAVPHRYRIVDRGHLAYEPATTELRGAPSLPAAAVGKLLKGFRIEHSFVLQHGVHEYVATRKRWYVKK
jgi:hypothetical protein